MNMESLVVFDFIGKQEFEKYIVDRLAGDFKFHLAHEIIKTEKHIANLESKAKHHDALVEALQKARTGYLNLIELELLPHQGYYDECQEHINEMDKVLANAKGES